MPKRLEAFTFTYCLSLTLITLLMACSADGFELGDPTQVEAAAAPVSAKQAAAKALSLQAERRVIL